MLARPLHSFPRTRNLSNDAPRARATSQLAPPLPRILAHARDIPEVALCCCCRSDATLPLPPPPPPPLRIPAATAIRLRARCIDPRRNIRRPCSARASLFFCLSPSLLRARARRDSSFYFSSWIFFFLGEKWGEFCSAKTTEEVHVDFSPSRERERERALWAREKCSRAVCILV